jgi:hypothetical protein
MEFLEHQRRQQVAKRREANEASKAVDTLLSLGWKSETFADIAAGLKQREVTKSRGTDALEKLNWPDQNFLGLEPAEFIQVRLQREEALKVLKAIGGDVEDTASDAVIAGAIAQRGNLLCKTTTRK